MKNKHDKLKSLKKAEIQQDPTFKNISQVNWREQQKQSDPCQNVNIPINMKTFIDKGPSTRGRKKIVKSSINKCSQKILPSLMKQDQFLNMMENQNQKVKQKEENQKEEKEKINKNQELQAENLSLNQEDQHSLFTQHADIKKEKKIIKRKGKRKIRTTINEQKIQLMMVLFNRLQHGIKYKGKFLNLKTIASAVGLGYSTILHKNRYYKQNGQIEKGIILKSKDIKRKYKKSHYIQNFIKQAFEEKEFVTKAQLAKYLQQVKGLKVSRGIVARHLNLMKNQIGQSESESDMVQQQKQQNLSGNKKCTDEQILISKVQTTGQKTIYKLQLDDQTKKYHNLLSKEKKKRAQNIKSMKSFGNFYISLKQKQMCCYYIDFIQFYYNNGKTSFQKPNQSGQYFHVKAMIVTSELQLIRKDIQIHYQLQTEVFKQKELNKYDVIMMELDNGLLNQLKLFPEMNPAEQTNVYFIFGDSQNIQTNDHIQVSAQKLRRKIETEQKTKNKNIIEMPPGIEYLNFIQKWFTTEIFPQIQEKTFTNYFRLQDHIEDAMNRKKINIKLYYGEMIQSLRNELNHIYDKD